MFPRVSAEYFATAKPTTLPQLFISLKDFWPKRYSPFSKPCCHIQTRIFLFRCSRCYTNPGSGRKRLGRYFFYFALIETQNPMAPSCKRQVVRGDERRKLVFSVQSCDQFKNHFPGASVQIARRFICKQQLRLRDECACQRQTLLFAARQFARAMMRTLLQSDLAQPAGSFGRCRRKRLPSGQERHGDVFEGGEFGEQVVELPHIADFAITKVGGGVFGQRMHLGICAVYGTRRRPIKSRQDVQQGAFSGTRLAHDGQHLALAYLKRKIFKEHEFRFA